MSKKARHRLVHDIRQGKNIEIYVTTLVSVAIVVLNLIGCVELEVVATATLAVLSVMVFSLVTHRATAEGMEDALEEFKGRMERSGLSDVLFPWRDHVPELRDRMTQANEVWVVTRSGLNFWREFSSELIGVANRDGTVRILLLDPDGSAFENYRNLDFSTADVNDPSLLKSNLHHLLKKMLKARQSTCGTFDVRIINHVTPLALVLTNPWPQHSGGTIQVGLGTVMDARIRPSLIVTVEDSEHWFAWFRAEFETMWMRSRPASIVLAGQ